MLLIFALLFNSQAQTQSVPQELILSSIWAEVLQTLPADKQLQYANYLTQSGQVQLTEVTEEVVVEKKTLSPGQQKIEEMKRKVREELKQKQATEKATPAPTTSKDSLKNWANKQEEFLRSSQKKVDGDLRAWQQKYATTLRQWDQAHQNFLKRVKEYKAVTFPVPIEKQKEVEVQKITKQITTQLPKTYHIVKGALENPIKDQKRRATCSAFAGVRAIEVMLWQKNSPIDLSEQYFYWASKPNCRTSKCSEKGSWVGYGLDYSKEYALPLENECPYQAESVDGNETQIPLPRLCQQGQVYVVDYSRLETIDEAISAMERDQLVIIGLKLKENFYTTQGIVFANDKKAQSTGLDSHAQGHALVLEGYIKLPPELHATEGKVCFLAANSWGEGWGKGGHACLSEKWLMQNRGKNPMVAVRDVKKN